MEPHTKQLNRDESFRKLHGGKWRGHKRRGGRGLRTEPSPQKKQRKRLLPYPQSAPCPRLHVKRSHEARGGGEGSLERQPAASMWQAFIVDEEFTAAWIIWPRIRAAKPQPSSRKFSTIPELCSTNPSAHWRISKSAELMPCKATSPRPRRHTKTISATGKTPTPASPS